MREASLHNSLSLRSAFREFCGGHTFTLLGCIREVRVLETHIEVFTCSFQHHALLANTNLFYF
jgi:hypothetical protein